MSEKNNIYFITRLTGIGGKRISLSPNFSPVSKTLTTASLYGI